MAKKLCVFCNNFYFQEGCEGYSDYTPGWSPTMGCDLNLVEFDMFNMTEEEYRRKLLTAETCEHYDCVYKNGE